MHFQTCQIDPNSLAQTSVPWRKGTEFWAAGGSSPPQEQSRDVGGSLTPPSGTDLVPSALAKSPRRVHAGAPLVSFACSGRHFASARPPLGRTKTATVRPTGRSVPSGHNCPRLNAARSSNGQSGMGTSDPAATSCLFACGLVDRVLALSGWRGWRRHHMPRSRLFALSGPCRVVLWFRQVLPRPLLGWRRRHTPRSLFKKFAVDDGVVGVGATAGRPAVWPRWSVSTVHWGHRRSLRLF